ncbi:MAG: hypothetical protein JNJ98_01910, partial [Gemmatimonadetes bacterium]|nr:hypothetical protein [Gemmatimonadota bacterium]
MNPIATRSLALAAALAVVTSQPSTTATVTVTEGTSMSVAASRDGQQLAIDLQGSIWLLPATGGEAKRLT